MLFGKKTAGWVLECKLTATSIRHFLWSVYTYIYTPFFTLVMQGFPVFQVCSSCNTQCLRGLQEVFYLVLVSGHALGSFQSYTGCHGYSQRSPGKGDALESSLPAPRGSFTLLSECVDPYYQNKQPWLHSSWSAGSCVLCSNPSARWVVLGTFQGKQSPAKHWTLPMWCRTEMVKGRQMGYEGEAALSPKLDLWCLWVLLTPSAAEQGSGGLLERGEILSSKLYKYVEILHLNMPKSV